MTKRQLPPAASVVIPADDGQLVAPSASRNAEAICDVLQSFAPTSGSALELASGTGQHVAYFAQLFPDLNWQPSDIEAERRTSIDTYTVSLPNVAAATDLNATSAGWHERFSGQNLIVLVNLLHLISSPEAETLIREAALALAPGGRLVLYGPFMRDGRLISDGDQRFHTALITQDPDIGYKNDSDLREMLKRVGLELIDMIEMPANNLAFVAEKTDI